MSSIRWGVSSILQTPERSPTVKYLMTVLSDQVPKRTLNARFSPPNGTTSLRQFQLIKSGKNVQFTLPKSYLFVNGFIQARNLRQWQHHNYTMKFISIVTKCNNLCWIYKYKIQRSEKKQKEPANNVPMKSSRLHSSNFPLKTNERLRWREQGGSQKINYHIPCEKTRTEGELWMTGRRGQCLLSTPLLFPSGETPLGQARKSRQMSAFAGSLISCLAIPWRLDFGFWSHWFSNLLLF